MIISACSMFYVQFFILNFSLKAVWTRFYCTTVIVLSENSTQYTPHFKVHYFGRDFYTLFKIFTEA